MLLSKSATATGKVKASLYLGKGKDAKLIDSKSVDLSELSKDPSWTLFKFDLPYFKLSVKGSYYLKLEAENVVGQLFWCGTATIDNHETFTEKAGATATVTGEASFEAFRSRVELISNYTQTDANYMLIHAWALYVSKNQGTPEDQEFIEQSYPIIKQFANYYLDKGNHYNKQMNLIYNPSLEHSRKIRYWQSYDLVSSCRYLFHFHPTLSSDK